MNPDHAEARHQRGLCHVHLRDFTGVQDFNRALQINPNLYQVHLDSSLMLCLSELIMHHHIPMFRFKTCFFSFLFFSKVHLSRAALYGAEGRYAKAVLDCNEAIRIQPKCVRAYLYKGALKFYLKVSKNSTILSIIISRLRLMLFVKFERNVAHLSSFLDIQECSGGSDNGNPCWQYLFICLLQPCRMFSGAAGLWAGDVVSFHVPTFHLLFQISIVCGIIYT